MTTRLSIFLCIALLGQVTATARAQVVIGSATTPVTQAFDTLASSGTSSALPSGWSFTESGAGADTTYAAGSGADTLGNTYSYGATGSTERALGQLANGAVGVITAHFLNAIDVPLELVVTYTGEQWRLGASGRSDRVDFQYSRDGVTWSDLDALDYTSSVTSGSVGALDGNAAANRTIVSGAITGFIVAPGSDFRIRWVDVDVAGPDDGLAIDDFSIRAVVCGDGVVQGSEQCEGDDCCTATCRFVSASTPCRPSAGECDVADTCSGTSATCVDVRRSTGTPCGSAVMGPCDRADSCNGTDVICANSFMPLHAPCGPAVSGDCDAPDECTGSSGECLPRFLMGAVCRPSTGACDAPEICTGGLVTCPPDSVAPAGVACRASTNPSCDPTESCDGVSSSCPLDVSTCVADGGRLDAGTAGASDANTAGSDGSVSPAPISGCGCHTSGGSSGGYVAGVTALVLCLTRAGARRRRSVRQSGADTRS